MDRLLHQQARTGDAGLAGGGEDAGDHAFDGVVDVRIVEHDVRRLAAEFHADAFEPLGCGFIDALAGGVGAGEGDLGDFRVFDQRRADFGAEAGHHIDHARRETGLFDELHELQR